MISGEKWRFKFISHIFNADVFLVNILEKNNFSVESVLSNKEKTTISKKFLDFIKKNQNKDYKLPFFYKEKGHVFFEEYYYLDHHTYIMLKCNVKNIPNFKQFNDFKNTLILGSLNANPCKDLFSSTISIEDGIIILDENSNELYASSNARLIYTKATNTTEFSKGDTWKEFFSKNKFMHPTIFSKTLKNENFMAQLSFFPLYKENILKYFIVIVRDLSKNLQLEIEKEKQINTMKEIHHMIKNNLQIIKSIVNIKSRRLSDKELIEDISIKLECLARVHEQLINVSEELSLRELLESLFKILVSSGKERLYIYGDLLGEYQKMLLLILALIELLQNSIKHAFVADERSKIFISIINKTDLVRITYLDFGDFKTEGSSKGYGSDLVKSLLVDGLNASYKRLPTINGTLFEIILQKF
ncbi:histidine kinase dimerization/phosphoacceptor domain -containing protein [Thermodesulfobium sp. 4217-1]|uniref:histidine kinase dimerization/phosphoacceptor domain -containing protein n=1 Tax=Thermodesulfobium sp. 4217-1 TaxID=3120013 RepID=UPI0032221B2B